jgi:hypothetical protein
MASPQQQTEQSALSGYKAFLGGVTDVSRNMQAIAGEIAKMSEETLEAGTKAAERLRDAHSLQEITDIQSDLLKESYTTTTNRYRRIAELAISTPQHLAQSAEKIAATLVEAGRSTTEQMSQATRKAGGASEAAHDKSREDAQAGLRQARG